MQAIFLHSFFIIAPVKQPFRTGNGHARVEAQTGDDKGQGCDWRGENSKQNCGCRYHYTAPYQRSSTPTLQIAVARLAHLLQLVSDIRDGLVLEFAGELITPRLRFNAACHPSELVPHLLECIGVLGPVFPRDAQRDALSAKGASQARSISALLSGKGSEISLPSGSG